jgi:tetratricopeptide (TPR) repeat protein
VRYPTPALAALLCALTSACATLPSSRPGAGGGAPPPAGPPPRPARPPAGGGAGDRATALALLSGEEPPIRVAHAMIEDGRIVPGAIDGAVSGIAELYVRLALDLNREDLGPLALGLARLATYLAPDNSEAWLVASELLAAEDRHDEAIAALAHVAADDPYAANVRDQRVRLLQAVGEGERALVEARALAEDAADATLADWMRLGDALERLGRHREAADVYERAIALGERDSPVEHWALWLLRGSALYNAGDWPAARTALRKAHRLAPDNPLVLNYLGYSLLTRREDMAEAEAMIREANRIAPDNAAITDSLGWALYLKGELPEAIALLERAAQAEPADVEINEHLGDAYYSAGRRIEARFAWRAALVHAEGEDAERLRAKIDTGLTPRLAAR